MSRSVVFAIGLQKRSLCIFRPLCCPCFIDHGYRSSDGTVPRLMISSIVVSDIRTARPTLTYGMVRLYIHARRHLTLTPSCSAACGSERSLGLSVVVGIDPPEIRL